ncbi:SUKH-4 family immunity protein [Glycomyces paridis]|uniref:SUKH-4 immunity protein of toxin-antitoxin system n=1 Tax=Glycomyces paridis TaxID=2126555 RepID=A0A4S8P8D4_9ACTN|nr:SUKH-4 family immunity protein [Glycomyces paridis]THV25941.1 hypothetical protein E9998_19605 [Glycomyces paridis]
MPAIEDRLHEATTAPLTTLVDPRHRVRPPPEHLHSWRIPEPDRRALADFGLPDDLLMTPAFQTGPDPTLSPNIAGPLEAEHARADDRLYDLGHWGAHDRTPKIGAVAGDGRVLAVRPAPLTAADLHPGLRDHYRDLYRPAVMPVNSSASALVETAWRVRAALAALIDLDAPPEPPPGPVADAHDARRSACEAMVLEALARIDPAACGPDSLWAEVVTDPGY